MSTAWRSDNFSASCLSGRTIVITGGSGALGQVMVARLLAHGAQVLNLDPYPFPLSLPAELEQGLKSVAIDITDERAVSDFFGTSCTVGGVAHQPDTVICHAGVVLPGAIETYSYAEWTRTFELNLNAHFLISRAAIPLLQKIATAQSPARILFTSSWVGQVPWPGNGAYSPSKAAIDMFAKGLARELAERHIRVNILSPGIVAAGMALKQWNEDVQYQQRAKIAIPVGSLQSAQSVAEATLFLCSRASDYMTGSTLLVDGGASLYPMI